MFHVLLHRDDSDFLRYIFFFFQAEDGIRDKLVTGVQTCALPISRCSVYQINGGVAANIRARFAAQRSHAIFHRHVNEVEYIVIADAVVVSLRSSCAISSTSGTVVLTAIRLRTPCTSAILRTFFAAS